MTQRSVRNSVKRGERATHSSCAWCGARFVPKPGPGRPSKYCRRSHRQRAYEARRLAEARSLAADEVIVARDDLQRLRDAVYVLETVLSDAEIDLAEGSSEGEALAMVTAAARQVTRHRIEPIAAQS